MSAFVDVLLVTSIILFVIGFIALPVEKLRINNKVRHYFVVSILLFSFSLALGWDAAVEAYNQGFEEAQSCCIDDSLSDSTETDDLPEPVD